MDFVAIDVETANPDMASICAVGLCRFEGGQLAGSTHFLVDPRDRFAAFHVALHGIDEEAVRGAPTMAKILPVMARHLTGRVVAHHTHFDRVALERAAARHDHPRLACRWLDTARVARRTWSDVANAGYGLRPLSQRLGFAFAHHDAREDARAAGLVLLAASSISGHDLDGWLARVERPIDLDRAAWTRGKVAGVAEGPLARESVVFTGTLSRPRVEMTSIAVAAGCDVARSVSKATTLLVVGDQDARRVAADGKSDKHRKAEALIASGAALRIVGESDFLRLLGRD